MDTLTNIFWVAIGGAAGAVLRHLVNISPLSGVFEKFPLPTFIINVLGSILTGFSLIFLTDKITVGHDLRMALVVGFLGAFTTFSTFEAEIFGLVRDGYFVLAGLYLVSSVVVGFGGLVVGVELVKQ